MRANEFIQKQQSINEGVNDPAIFKVIFVIGGPGSGKSFISDKLGLSALGYVTINSDIAFEYLMRKHDIDPKMPPEEKEKRDVVRQRAKDITANKSELAIDGRLGIVIDGTGDDYEKISKLKTNFDNLGYNNFLVVVNTRLEVARQRNQQRARTVPDKIVVDSWYAVQNNIGKFNQIFENISIIDNSGDLQATQEQIQSTYKKILNFTNKEPNKPAAKKWIESQTQVSEASYPGNIGMMEMYKFFQTAPEHLVVLMKQLISQGKQEEAWQLLQKVLGVKLKEKQLNELFDIEQAFPLKWSKGYGEHRATTTDSEGNKLVFLFTQLSENFNAIDFDFKRNESFDVTGQGEAPRVFATAIKALEEYLEKINQPDYILFAAKEVSRSKLYQRLVTRFASQFGYKPIPYDQLPKEIADQPTPEGQMFVLGKVN